MNIKALLSITVAFLFPVFVFAETWTGSASPATACTDGGLVGVACAIGQVIAVFTPVVVALALLAFFWGLAIYILNFSGEEKDKKKGRDIMTYGLIALFVMMSVWGLVQILQNTFFSSKSDVENSLPIPCLDYPGSNCPR